MRFIHTADWHLGKRLHDHSLHDVQRELLTAFVALVADAAPDAVVVAGDVFDTQVPSLGALELWDQVVEAVVGEHGVPMVVIPGNHDHPGRLAVHRGLARRAGLHHRSALADSRRPVTVAGVDVYGVPFHKPVHVAAASREEGLADADRRRDRAAAADRRRGGAAGADHRDEGRLDGALRDEAPALGDFDYAGAMRRVLARIDRDTGRPAVLVAHAYVAGAGEEPDGEDAIMVGGAGAVPAALFDGFAYVALGHLHGARRLGSGGEVRYSGSLYPYSFAEATASDLCGPPRPDGSERKGVYVVEVLPDGRVGCEAVPLEPGRWVQVVEGLTFAEVLRRAANLPARDRDHYTLVRIVDDGPVENAIARLREALPNAVLEQPAVSVGDAALRLAGDYRRVTTEDALRQFYRQVYDADMTPLEEELLREVVAETAGEGVPA